MKVEVLDEYEHYDGSQIAPLWALETHGIKGDSIVVFRGSMDVVLIKDVEDTDIKGDDLIHFIMERFASPSTMWEAYLIQRLFISVLAEVIKDLGVPVHREGDDLFVGEGKLTVSIASVSAVSEKLHCGVNLSVKGVPKGVAAASLPPKVLEHFGGWQRFGREVAERVVAELVDIERDITKTKPL